MRLNQKSIPRKKLIKAKRSWLIVSLTAMVLNSSIIANADDNQQQTVNDEKTFLEALYNKNIHSIRLDHDIVLNGSEINHNLPRRNLSIDLANHYLNWENHKLSFEPITWDNQSINTVKFTNGYFNNGQIDQLKPHSSNTNDNSNIAIEFDHVKEREKTFSDSNAPIVEPESYSSKSQASQTSLSSHSSPLSDGDINNDNQSSNHLTQEKDSKTKDELSNADSSISNSSNIHNPITSSSTNEPLTSSSTNYSKGINKNSFSASNGTENHSNSNYFSKASNDSYHNDKNLTNNSQLWNHSKNKFASDQKFHQTIYQTLSKLITNLNDTKLELTTKINSLKNNQDKQKQQTNPIIKVAGHHIKIKQRCYIYSDATFDIKKRLRLATNDELANQIVEHHAYSKYGRLRYKVKDGFITANPNFVENKI